MLTLIDVDAELDAVLPWCSVRLYGSVSSCNQAKRASALTFGIACMLDMHRLAMDRARGAAVIVATHHPRTGA